MQEVFSNEKMERQNKENRKEFLPLFSLCSITLVKFSSASRRVENIHGLLLVSLWTENLFIISNRTQKLGNSLLWD